MNKINVKVPNLTDYINRDLANVLNIAEKVDPVTNLSNKLKSFLSEIQLFGSHKVDTNMINKKSKKQDKKGLIDNLINNIIGNK
jgi:hypothetical protein